MCCPICRFTKSSGSERTGTSPSIGKEENDLDTITVNSVPYNVIKLLGKGKGGYSYLARREDRQYVKKHSFEERPCKWDGPGMFKMIIQDG